ncbi:MAG: CmcJ/NvfI family oxidoreductase [Gammaproteobacteria bacterium]
MSSGVQASLRYGVNTSGRRSRVLRRGIRLEYDDSRFEERSVTIHNGRPLADSFLLDRDGFVFVRHETLVKDFFDRDELENVYYPEVKQLVRRITGGSRVVVFDHTLRAGDELMRQEKKIREPVIAVHNDYTENSAPQRVRDLLPDEADELLKHRFQIVQVWRPVNVPAIRSPLALCNAASISTEDLILTELVYEHRTGEIYHLAYNPEHEWYYFPEMQADEALVFKVYDSLDDGRARYTAHGAFDDPSTLPDAPPRQSIEVRTLVFF